MKLKSLAAIGAILLPSLSGAADAVEECQVRGLTIQAGVPAGKVYAHQADGSSSAGEINLRTFLNHEFDKLSRSGEKFVFTLNADPASTKDREAEIGSCEIPAEVKSAILIFIPQESGSLKCQVLVVPDDGKAFPSGSINVANFSTLPVKIELEDKEFMFKPGEILAIKDPPVGKRGTAGMKAYCQREGAWQKFSSGLWPHPGKKRVLQVLTEDPVSKQVLIRSMRDVVEP